ncbi:DUF4232 domain-containing protein [Nocardioides sp. BP30]|uniref:DUF4232 domain-containing protein n=1 Tax=Nocardioides sp. BP30 TaxID=3036374 RepID=UPI0024693FC7|nr:DUF4232 domain-containing protein [Nocardioides sp. BP30]WGL51999.1 DUF4232 domain-containing protein [Nocardioides sp. BP30]
MSPSRMILGAALAGGIASGVLTALPGTPAGAAVPECSNADLAITFRVHGAAAGSMFGTMRYKNTSDHSCRTGGYGGLSFVGHGNGTQVGAAATRAPGTPVRSFVLRPGQRATSRVQIAQTANYDRSLCRPRKVDGFRVFVPDSYAGTFVPYRTRACSRKVIASFSPQLSHQALRKKG